jgi:hypothetical protein
VVGVEGDTVVVVVVVAFDAGTDTPPTLDAISAIPFRISLNSASR